MVGWGGGAGGRAQCHRHEHMRATGGWLECGQDWMPGDTLHSITFRKKHGEFANSVGPLYTIALLGKEPAWREAVREGWDRLPASSKVVMGALASKLRGGGAADEGARAAHEVHLASSCTHPGRSHLQSLRFSPGSPR